MLAIRLDKKVEDRLTKLARKTGRTKTYYAREAILEHLEELEDTHLALERLAKPARIYSAAEVKRALGV
jgi:RHH-type rel operon transcriptional repressor/antitoxin RelB